MKKFLSVLLVVIFSSVAIAQDYSTLRSNAEKVGNEKLYSQAVELYRQAFSIDSKNKTDLYNAACYASLAGDKDQAFTWLELVVQIGYDNLTHLKADTDLLNLHTDARWEKLITQLTERIAFIEKDYDKPLQKQLLQILQDDQQGRMQLDALEQKYGFQSKEVKEKWDSINQLDEKNLGKIKTILKKYGWVGAYKVGAQANQTIFLVIQHADLKTQQQYLPMMREAVKDKRANAGSLALLEDRVALGEGRNQIYGSQLTGDENGQFSLSPIEDPDNVDVRRASVGLPPLAEYLQHWNLTWNVEAHKKANAKPLK
jgi:hypothetical protein